MEMVLVSAATGALKPVLEKLFALMGDEYKRFKGVRGEIQFLMDELTAMHAFLLKMSEEEEPDEQDKVWMTAVRELSYDMEDSIDDFMQGVGNKDSKPDGFIEKIKNSLGKLGKMKARRRIGNEIHDLKKQIIDVAERNERYKTRQAISNIKNEVVDPRALVIFEHASKLIGMDRPKADLAKLLNKKNGWVSSKEEEPLKIVSIVGSGGLGKTTLANQVYQEHKEEFQCCAFLSVSRRPDMMNILRNILSQVSNQCYDDTKAGSIQQVISNITEFLADKSINLITIACLDF
ncbi:disease resistance protein Pik-2-like [Triticum dicoccoides]|uniref:disease resistance protein Pik-2-like n=1 Tax=Triticum dicoccoides TaxID=85692 RepID=UPI001890E9B4|nr:disease resistance protein Pik-2-like [Triticum dicoccoides]